MTSTNNPTAVIGATGNQGGAVLDALLARGAKVRAIVRNPEKARGLATHGAVELAAADLQDHDALTEALSGTAAVFAMTTMTGPRGTDGEVADGRAIADAAVAAETPHLVYSSVGGAERATGIPHFESKWQVEKYLRTAGVPTVVIRPTFFYENFLTGFSPAVEDGEVVLRAPFAPSVPLQMIALADVGAAAASALLDAAAVPGAAVEIAGDELTAEAMTESYAAAAGLPGRFESQPVEVIQSPDAQAMFTWFQTLPAYHADFELTRKLTGKVTSFRDFVTAHPA